MASVTISRSEDRLIAVKQAPAERAGEIEREADVLRRLSHPGVVEIIDLRRGGDGAAALHTEFVGSDNWATRPLTDPVARAAAAAALAAVVADLHDIGIAHRNLDGSHVLHGVGDRPVLCSFGRSGDAGPEHRREDLVALADLVWDEALAPGPVTGKLANLAASTRAGRLGARELARRLDRLVGGPDPKPKGPQIGQGLGSDKKPEPGPRRRRRRAVPATAAGLAVMATAFTVVLGGSAGGQDPAGPTAAVSGAGEDGGRPPGSASQPLGLTGVSAGAPASGSIETAVESADTAAASGAATEASGSTATGGAPDHTATGRDATETSGFAATGGAPDHTATGRPTTGSDATGRDATGADNPTYTSLSATEPGGSAEPAAGLIHDRDGRRYAIGTEGDLVVIGDWNCDGVATPAIARPGTGQVAMFDRWPPPEATISESDASARRVVDDLIGVELERGDGPGACDRLRVHTATRSHLLASGGDS